MKPSAAMSKLLGLGKKDKWEWSWIPKYVTACEV